MKKLTILIGLGMCALLFTGCCGGLLFWGYALNTQDANREFTAAEAEWAIGNKADAVAKYKNLKKQFLSKDQQAVLDQRVREFMIEHTNRDLALAHQEWTAGKKTEAVARYRSLDLSLVETAEQDTIKLRIEEIDRLMANQEMETANKLWLADERTKAIATYRAIRADLLALPDQLLVTRRLLEAADAQWADGWKANAAESYKRVQQDLLTETERAAVAQRLRESEQADKKFAAAERTRHGKRVRLKTIELYYTPAVTPAEARKLAEVLESVYSRLDHEVTMQITKDGDRYQFRVVLKKGAEIDQPMTLGFQVLGKQISHLALDDGDVEIHLCDEHLKTLRVVTPADKS